MSAEGNNKRIDKYCDLCYNICSFLYYIKKYKG